MGTTTKMAIPYPEATGLVKDGWEDMKDIATQVDVKTGLVLLNTTTFSGVSSQPVNTVFSASFDHYRLVVNFSSFSADGFRHLRLRSGTTDATTGYTYAANGIATNNAAYPLYSGSAGFWNFGDTDSATNQVYSSVVDLINPFNSVYSNILYLTHSASGAGLFFANAGGGIHTVASSYDGITLTTSAGTMSGTISVYGYNK